MHSAGVTEGSCPQPSSITYRKASLAFEDRVDLNSIL
jgi:hypothetical protein